jgi:TetR/AcrR family transcriptional regulator, mexCD-oprJ operon repressor
MPTISTASPDHRRATAQRNAGAILDAVERLLNRGEPLSILALSKEAGLSRPTVYAHYKSVGAAVEAAVERTVVRSTAAFRAARPQDGPPREALARLVAASWGQLAGSEGMVARAREHVPPGAQHRTHGTLTAPLEALIERGRAAGAFRTDVPADWLVTLYLSLLHGAADHAAAHDLPRDEALALVTRTIAELYSSPSSE